MFGIGPVELIIIAVVGLMLFTPKELPGIIRTFTKFWGSLRATADDFKDAIMNEEELDEIKKALKGGKDELKKAETAARRELMKARVEMQKAQNKLIKTVKASEQVQKQEALAADGTASAANPPAVNEPGTATPGTATPGTATPATPVPAAPASATSEPAPVASADPLGPDGTIARSPSPKPGDGVDQGAA